MRRMLPLLAALVVLPAPAAVAKPHRAFAAATSFSTGWDVLILLRETPGTIRGVATLAQDGSGTDNANIVLARGACDAPAGRSLALATAASGEARVAIHAQTGSTRLVVPRARSVRVSSGGQQEACAGVAHLRRGKHPTVTLSSLVYSGESGGLNILNLTQERDGKLDYCGISSPVDTQTGESSGKRVRMSLLSRTREVLASWIAITPDNDLNEAIAYSGTTDAADGATRRARRLRVENESDPDQPIVVGSVKRFEMREAWPICGG